MIEIKAVIARKAPRNVVISGVDDRYEIKVEGLTPRVAVAEMLDAIKELEEKDK